MRTLILLLGLTVAAGAQDTVSTGSVQSAPISECHSTDGDWREWGYVCHSNPGQRIEISSYGRVPTLATSNMITTTNSTLPKCEEGWSSVMTSGGQPMCARELKEPIR